LCDLIDRSLGLLDRGAPARRHDPFAGDGAPAEQSVERQLGLLKAAFGARGALERFPAKV